MRAGDWLARALGPFGEGLRSLVPAGFAAYARLLHPAWLGSEKVRWRELGPVGAETRFEALDATGVTPPFTGTLEADELEALAPAGECWCGVWAGFGWMPDPLPTPVLELPERPLLLYKGHPTALYDAYAQSPTLWWPDDHAWCVASEIDFHSTYVGGSRELIDRLLHDARLETVPIPETARVTD